MAYFTTDNMVSKKTRYFEINSNEGGFVSKLRGEKKDYDFSDLQMLRNVLTNEKGRILHMLKFKEPESIYQLAKMLKRDLKSVRTDMKVLERLGFIEYHSHKRGKRTAYKPILTVEKMEFILHI